MVALWGLLILFLTGLTLCVSSAFGHKLWEYLNPMVAFPRTFQLTLRQESTGWWARIQASAISSSSSWWRFFNLLFMNVGRL